MLCYANTDILGELFILPEGALSLLQTRSDQSGVFSWKPSFCHCDARWSTVLLGSPVGKHRAWLLSHFAVVLGLKFVYQTHSWGKECLLSATLLHPWIPPPLCRTLPHTVHRCQIPVQIPDGTNDVWALWFSAGCVKNISESLKLPLFFFIYSTPACLSLFFIVLFIVQPLHLTPVSVCWCLEVSAPYWSRN